MNKDAYICFISLLLAQSESVEFTCMTGNCQVCRGVPCGIHGDAGYSSTDVIFSDSDPTKSYITHEIVVLSADYDPSVCIMMSK